MVEKQNIHLKKGVKHRKCECGEDAVFKVVKDGHIVGYSCQSCFETQAKQYKQIMAVKKEIKLKDLEDFV